MSSYRTILSLETERLAWAYGDGLRSGERRAGLRLAEKMLETPNRPGADLLLQSLLETKQPQIFAESAVRGDGSDWNAIELEILGDISIAADVQIFDDGQHTQPTPHETPFPGTLVFTCGALLHNGRGLTPADLPRVQVGGDFSFGAYYRLYSRRLNPVFQYIQETAAERGEPAVVTVPGLGCGQFAGKCRGRLGTFLNRTLARLLEERSSELTAIRAVVFDPYDECRDEEIQFGSVKYRVRPLTRSSNPHPQLCAPVDYEEAGDDFADCALYSLVAWDPVSWPGNDFYVGSRMTDDGVKAAATSSMCAMTGFEGRYDDACFQYRPPPSYESWEQVVQRNALTLRLAGAFIR